MAKELYVKPQVLATYSREELEDTIRPHGAAASYSECDPRFGECGTPGDGDFGCGCGCGC